MAVQITRVQVRNFRSIGPEGVDLTPGMLCPLIGENNSGKSNILAAVDRILGRTRPTIENFAVEDFYRGDASVSPYIRIDFDAFGPHYFEFKDAGQVSLSDGRSPANLLYDNKYASNANREMCPFTMIGVDREIGAHLAYDRWTLLGRLLQMVNTEFKQNEQAVADFVSKMNEVRDLLMSVGRFDDLLKAITAETAKLLRREESDLGIKFEFYDPWNFYRTLQIISQDDGMPMQAGRMGMGLQSMLTVAILKAYAELAHSEDMSGVIAIEEPEIFLHPQAQRNFYKVLRSLADAGMQVFYTTHSPSFVDVAYFDEICLVKKSGSPGSTTTSVKQVSLDKIHGDYLARAGAKEGSAPDQTRVHIAKRFGIEENEAFFASKLLLVEGPTEAAALRVYGPALDLDFDKEGVVICDVEKPGLADLYRLMTEFGIPSFVVFDGDKDDAPGKGHPERNRELLELFGESPVDYPVTAVTERYAVFECDFERTMMTEIPDYAVLAAEADGVLGLAPTPRHKPLRARFIAQALVERGERELIPNSIRAIVDAVKNLTWRGSVLRTPGG